jgi:hypothetical protein
MPSVKQNSEIAPRETRKTQSKKFLIKGFSSELCELGTSHEHFFAKNQTTKKPAHPGDQSPKRLA